MCMDSSIETRYETPYFKAFWTGFIIFMVAVIPTLFTSRGAFIYYGDFNVQQIPFYMHVHDLVRHGNFFYDFSTDLGGSVIGTYAFYLLGSPFFYLTLPFPTRFIPWLMPWIIGVKYGVMTVTSYAYLRRHTKTDEAAFLGALLFSFSGYQGAVLVYNHFHDAVAFFPLLLLAFERLVEKKKYLGFILMTAVCACINYYFFVGQALFLVIYFFCCYGSLFKESKKDFFMSLCRCAITGALGLLLASPYLYPAVSYAFFNDRLKDFVMGYDVFSYKEPTMPLGIVKSAVMISDVSGLKGLFNESMSRVSGLGAYIPLFSISGVIAYLAAFKKSPFKNIFITCLIFSMVPVLNASFSAFNSEYYARWFYMPVLIMCLMTVKVLEEDKLASISGRFLKNGLLITTIIVFLFIMASLVPFEDGEELNLLIYKNNPEMFLTEAIATVVLLGGAWFFIYKDKLNHRRIFVIAGCYITAAVMVIEGSFLTYPEEEKAFLDQTVMNACPVTDDSGFYRIETEECVYNYPMMWEGVHSITSFISTIPPSTMAFYEGIGESRKVTSYLNEEREGARTLLSGKYFLIEKGTPVETISFVSDPGKLQGYAYCYERNGFQVYENRNFIPMGFSFDEYITETEYVESGLGKRSKDRLLLKCLILSDEDAEKYDGILTHTDISVMQNMTYKYFTKEVELRKETACRDFTVNKRGFTAEADMAKENIVFFSVPFEKGFRAYIDGEEAEIIKCDFGFMGVLVPAGPHTITFRFWP